MIFKLARFIRHGPFKRFSPMWLGLGHFYRWAFKFLNLSIVVKHQIGPYGPFKLDGYFAFSNFSSWGSGHNNGFEACIEACKNARCFIDIGAHVGLVSIPAAKVMEGNGEVHAFEPGAVNLGFLQRHVKINCLHNIRVNDLLVGEANGFIDFFEADYPNGQNSRVATSRVAAYRQVKRQQVSLDDYVQRNKLVPDIIKIDVEGAETAVISGARQTLKLHKPLIFLSVHPSELAQTPGGLDGLVSVINKCGYQCYELDGRKVSQFRLAEYVLKFEG